MCSRFGVLLGLLLAGACAGTTASAAEGTFSWTVDEAAGTAVLKFGNAPVLDYQFGYDTSTPETIHNTYKIFHHAYGPGTDERLTKGPGGAFTHHRGLFVGWNKTSWGEERADFWHCTQGAHQRHRKIVSQSADDQQGSMTTEIDWMSGRSDSPILRERRTITARRIETAADPGFGWQIDWSSRLETELPEVLLDGDRQHAGFQFRAAQEVADGNAAKFLRPQGVPQKPPVIQVNDNQAPDDHINLNWFAMQFPVAEKSYCVQYLEAPGMPRPARYSERAYGRFGTFFQAVVTPEKPLVMNYRLFVTTEAPPSPEQLQNRWEQYAKEIATTKQP